jgi:hypothetical protein
MKVKCNRCGAYESEDRKFMSCENCGDLDRILDPLGRVQLYNPDTNRKAGQSISYTKEQLIKDLKTFNVKKADLYHTIGAPKANFTNWAKGKLKIPQYIQAACWMYFEIVKLKNNHTMSPKRVINIANNVNEALNKIADRIGKDPEDLAGDIIAKVVLEPRTYFVCCSECDVELFDTETMPASGIMSGKCQNGHPYKFDLETEEFV